MFDQGGVPSNLSSKISGLAGVGIRHHSFKVPVSAPALSLMFKRQVPDRSSPLKLAQVDSERSKS